MNTHLEQAKQLAPVVERVHGGSHPELTEVRRLTEQLADGSLEPAAGFAELRDITDGYALPEGACKGYASYYENLSQADRDLTA